MTGQLITSDHKTYTLPSLLRWEIVYTGSVPCDSYSVTFLYDASMAEPLHLAAGFAAVEGGDIMLRGIVDEYTVELTAEGLTATVTGRGYAARLLDNESRPLTYQGATLAEIVRNHVTPYGIQCEQLAAVAADSAYTVAAGSSQWKALANFCETYGGFTPRFQRDGKLLAVPETDSGRRLVIDKTRNTSYTVYNQDMIDRGGQCRRVLYTPGQSTWAAMRYTGEYQIAKSRKGERTVTIRLPGNFLAFPGERVLVQLERMGISGEFRVTEADNLFSVKDGSTVTVTLEEA